MAKWTKEDRYEPWLPFDERVARIRGRFSSGEHYRRRLAVFDRASARVDREAVCRLQAKYRNVGWQTHGPSKYLDIGYWLWHKTDVVCRLDLDRSPPMSILDIGMGGGHFSFVCEALGHTTVGTDVPDALYDDICEALGVQRVTTPVKAFGTLPLLGERFGLVTAMWLMFNFSGHGKQRRYWEAAEWAWFLSDVSRRLNPGGRVYLELNQHTAPDGALYWDEAFIDLCFEAGARIDDETHRSVTLDARSIRNFVGLADNPHLTMLKQGA